MKFKDKEFFMKHAVCFYYTLDISKIKLVERVGSFMLYMILKENCSTHFLKRVFEIQIYDIFNKHVTNFIFVFNIISCLLKFKGKESLMKHPVYAFIIHLSDTIRNKTC